MLLVHNNNLHVCLNDHIKELNNTYAGKTPVHHSPPNGSVVLSNKWKFQVKSAPARTIRKIE